jgi:hypothetical protein
MVTVCKKHIKRSTHFYARDELHVRQQAAPWVARHFDYPDVEFKVCPDGFGVQSLSLPGTKTVSKQQGGSNHESK